MIVNVWLAIRDDAQGAVITRLNWDEETQGTYSGPVGDREHRIFKAMADRAEVQRLFEKASINSNLWNLWSVTFDETKSDLNEIADELDYLALTYPNQFIIGGAWFWDGRQVNGYPPHPKLIEFMPDVVTYDENGNELSRTRPTVVSDVNVGLGQSPRTF